MLQALFWGETGDVKAPSKLDVLERELIMAETAPFAKRLMPTSTDNSDSSLDASQGADRGVTTERSDHAGNYGGPDVVSDKRLHDHERPAPAYSEREITAMLQVCVCALCVCDP
jgi:hypothetical protein